jgi:hypothetical protein
MTNATNSVTHRHFLKFWWRHTSAGGWTEYRNIGTAEIAWFQRIYEAWWIMTGRWSLEKAYRSGITKSIVMKREN